MSENRLKIMRKTFGKTQSEIARVVNITQNAYSYWENGKVNIDAESLKKLADYYGVSLDFLSGREFEVTVPPHVWSKEQQQEYYTSVEYKKTYLEYLWGAPMFSDEGAKILAMPNTVGMLTDREARMLAAYRSMPHMQIAVDKLLGIDDDAEYTVYEAAKSSDNHAPRIVYKSALDWERIENAPETDEKLI